MIAPFQNLKKLAKANRIHTILGDVSSPEDTAAVVTGMTEWGEQIGALDFSNVVPFIEYYGHKMNYQKSRKLWNNVLHPNALVIATIPEGEWDVGLRSGQSDFATYWLYILENNSENTGPLIAQPNSQ